MKRFVVVTSRLLGVETRQDALVRAKHLIGKDNKAAYILELIEVVQIAEPPIVQREPMEGDLQ